jgi:Nitrile hydratase, alpha chain
MSEPFDRHQTEAKINIRAWKDPAFKDKLKANPKAALKEMGMEKIPQALEVRVAVEEKNQWVIRLHNRPLNFKELSEEALHKAARGELQEAKCCPKKSG